MNLRTLSHFYTDVWRSKPYQLLQYVQYKILEILQMRKCEHFYNSACFNILQQKKS